MPSTVIPSKTHKKTSRPQSYAKRIPLYAAKEINAYIEIRDQLLAEAEKTRSAEKFDSVLIANDFVAGCLKPARSPYELQCLPEAQAEEERKRCAAVNNRVAILRSSAA
jgi:hypothetical protein